MNIIFWFSGSFPDGGAYTNRLLSLSRGLHELGNQVSIYIPYPGPYSDPQKKTGSINGVNYHQTYTGVKKPRTRVGKLLITITGVFRALRGIIRQHRNQPVDCIISCITKISFTFPVYITSRLLKIIFIREKNEHPMVILKKDQYNAIYRYVFLHLYYRVFDGMMVISHELYRYFDKVLKGKMPIRILPMTVDPNRFTLDKNTKRTHPFDYIAYCGNLWGSKDGVNILLESFGRVHNKYSTIKLLLIGDTSNQLEYQRMKDFIVHLKVRNKIIFTGRVGKDAIPELLINATVLCLPRPDSLLARGGFPTKLGEYLSTGNPVIATRVGEIPQYLVDGQNAFLAEPGSVNSFTEKLDFVLSDLITAKKIGLQGRKLAYKEFNYKTQALGIIDFIKGIKKNG